MCKQGLAFLTFFLPLIFFGQNANYFPLEAKGKIPADFTNYTIEKINAGEHNHSEEFLSLSKKYQKHFLSAIHQGIDEILRSGKVLFGDTLTQYVNAVGKKILGNDESLKHIRFYTLKSNVVNAFSTNQGIIFVSQGLLAQVKSEAQLAFVLAHELAHYTQRHVIVGFKENMDLMTSRRSISEKIKRYSIYSKDKEYEADRVGVALYHKAGYSLQDLYSVFDLLTFSYLPFESKQVDMDYFNSKMLYLPTSFYKQDLPKIAPDIEVDDSRSTHPNIKSRRDQLTGEIPKYTEWETKTTNTSHAAFEYARSIARLEQIRNNLYEFDYIAALYNVFLLEEDFKDNVYFNQYKAQTWLGLLIFKSFSRFADISSSLTRIQGEQHQMHHVIRALNRRQLATLALRNIYDIQKRFPHDNLIQDVYKNAVINVSSDEKFKLKDFYNLTYADATAQFGPNVSQPSRTNAELTMTNSELAVQRAKYGISNEGSIDDNDFYRYALSDLIQDENFVKLFEEMSKKRKLSASDSNNSSDKETKKTRKFGFFSFRNWQNEQRRIQQNQLRSGINRVILFEPRGYATRNGRADVVESEKLEITIKNAFDALQVDFMQVVKIGSKELKDGAADLYNEKAVLMYTLTQLLEHKEIQLFPVDYAQINTLRKKYNTDKVAFIVLESESQPWKTKLAALSLLTSFPLLSLNAQKTADQSTFSIFLFDLKTYSLDGVMRYNLSAKPSSIAVQALSHEMLHLLHAPKITLQND